MAALPLNRYLGTGDAAARVFSRSSRQMTKGGYRAAAATAEMISAD
jgi:hypothetical protein